MMAKNQFEEIGVSGYESFGGMLREAYTSELYWPACEPEYSRIWRSQPETTIVRTILEAFSRNLDVYFELPETQGNKELPKPTGGDKRALDFANEVLEDIEGGIEKWLISCITRVPFYGFGFWEVVPGLRKQGWAPPQDDPWRSSYNDGRLGIRRIAFRHYQSFMRWITHPETDRVLAMEQMSFTRPVKPIPVENALHIIYGDHDNPEGLATMEAVWRLERIKYGLEIILGMGYEHSAGHLSITSEKELTDADMTQIRRAAKAILSAQEGNFAAWPKGFKGEIIDVPFQAGQSILEAIRYYGILVMALYFMQWAALGSLSPYGSYSSMQDASQFYMTVFNSMTAGLIRQADDQLGKRLFEHPLNQFPGMTRRPVLRVSTLDKEIPLAEMGSFLTAINSLMPLGDEDLISIRRKSGFLPDKLPDIASVAVKPKEPEEPEQPEDDPAGGEAPEKNGEKSGKDKPAAMSKSEHDGVMVAFMMPPAIRKKLALDIEGALDPDELHCTLAYLGDISEQAGDKNELIRSLTNFATGYQSIDGEISGVAVFNNIHLKGKRAIVALLDCPDLPEFRQSLVNICRGCGFEPVSNHGFTPHITLAYVDQRAKIDLPEIPVIGCAFDTFTLAWGNELTDFQMGFETELALRPVAVPADENPTDVSYYADDLEEKINTAVNEFEKWARENRPELADILNAEIEEGEA